MAIGDPYVSLDELKEYLKMTGKASYDDALQDALNSVTMEIEGRCNRQFNKATSASQRSYYPTTRYMAKVHDFYTTEDLVVTWKGTTLTEGTDFELQPLDGIVDNRPGWPFWKVKLLGGRCFPKWDNQNGAPLTVTARWGWNDVPAPIKQACLIMAAETFQLKDSPFCITGMDAFGSPMRVRDNAIAVSKLGPYVRDRFLVG
jgi:hypothetical protein